MKINTKGIAFGGVMGAICIIILFLQSALPFNRLSLMVLVSFIISIVVIEYGHKIGWLFYIATSLLAFMLVPDKISLIPYWMFFGFYGIIKSYIEKLNKIYIEYILKLIFFNLFALSLYFFFIEVTKTLISISIPWLIILAILQPLFIIYDKVYSKMIYLYIKRVQRIIK